MKGWKGDGKRSRIVVVARGVRCDVNDANWDQDLRSRTKDRNRDQSNRIKQSGPGSKQTTSKIDMETQAEPSGMPGMMSPTPIKSKPGSLLFLPSLRFAPH